jgi:hypothetical protein
LAACGGGSESTPSTSATPQSVASAMRAGPPLLSTAAVSPTDAANQLMDAAEAGYPQFFPSHQPTQSFAPFLFRYYPETGIYLGVVVTANSFYTLNGVYAAGTPFGGLDNPTYIGLVTSFITPVDPGTGGTANGCFDLALADTQGTHIVIGYTYSGSITGTESVDTTVGAMTTFEGHSARETTMLTTGSHTSSGQTVAVNTTGKSYTARTGDAEMTQYGFTSAFSTTASGFTIATTIRTVLAPPYVDRMYGLAVGESATATMSGSSTNTMSGIPGVPDQTTTSPFSTTSTTRYVGQEPVTVPAGTFNACKFEMTTSGSTDVSTSWFVVGKGIHVKTAVTGLTIEATSATVNGAPL